ncbi:MAG: FAD-binding oxidoreductase [Acidimicrobiales bacterium]|nr:FAD-binding oxidoreductase [Acidimicrobiales bacterium]
MTAGHVDVAVVGRGMLGSPCARRLAEAGCSVLLVGQGEPVDRRSHDGVFASHHDDTRITRVIDPDPLRAWLGHRALDDFRRLEAATGERILTQVGHLWVAPPDEIDELAAADARFDLGCTRHDPVGLRTAFPHLSPPDGLDGILQGPGAGHLDPRAYVRAEGTACVAAGGTVVDALVASVLDRGTVVELETSAGAFRADRVVLATGPFFAHGDTPAGELGLTVGTHTMLHVEVSPADVERLAGLPSLIVRPTDEDRHCFVLPPKECPDGRVVIKIGISHQGQDLGADRIAAWFRTDGDLEGAAHQERLLLDLLPGLEVVRRLTVPCVTTYTATGHPVIDDLTDRVSALVGGNGYAAKCAPALGGLAAGRLLGQPWPTEVERRLFERAPGSQD